MQKILIVEDEKLIRESIVELLTEEEFECYQAENGRAGIAAAKKYLPDLILCDIKMPGLNGYKVLQEVRKDNITASIPVIFLSALADSKDVRAGMNLGADDYIAKPFLPDELIASIKSRLSRNEVSQQKIEQIRSSIAKALPHELRTPLVSIIGYSQIMMDRFTSPDEHENFEFAKSIYQAGLRLNHLIRNFITYTKLEILSKDSEKLNSAFVPLSISLIKSIVEKTAEQYNRATDITIKMEKSNVAISPNDLSLIIEELIDNAFKFSLAGSKVVVNGYNDNNKYYLIISDNGRGFTAEQISQVGAYIQFERDNYEQQGAGLGLIISKKLTEMYGGQFLINSIYGERTEIIIVLPSAQ
ncbi:MAG TPA: response regulator [Ignavibacteriaceae bacterium]|nr:response regulator [Ignavibacteriaceae bacterium]